MYCPLSMSSGVSPSGAEATNPQLSGVGVNETLLEASAREMVDEGTTPLLVLAGSLLASTVLDKLPITKRLLEGVPSNNEDELTILGLGLGLETSDTEEER